MKEYILALISVIIALLLSVINCQYSNPYSASTGRDLITNLDLSTDWTRGNELLFDTTSESPPETGLTVYYVSFENLHP